MESSTPTSRASGRGLPLARKCRDCRRPEGDPVIAWADGVYARYWPAQDSYVVYTARGRIMQDDSFLFRDGWKPVTATLDEAGRCARCAYLARGRA